MMTNHDHETQRSNMSKVIEHLEIAKSYCDLLFSCAPDISDNALSAELEPYSIQELIDRARYSLSLIGAEWDIQCSVLDGDNND